MSALLDLCSGICWSLVYVFAIFKGIRERTWCIPKLAICLNFSWELQLVYSKLIHQFSISTTYVVLLVWLILDAGIMITLLLYDKKGNLLKNLSLLLVAMVAMWFFAYRLNQWVLIAFLINAIMSLAFLLRVEKTSYEWMSVFIGVMKLIGTFAATLVEGVIKADFLLLWLGLCCFLFDVLYLILLVRKNHTDIRPLT